jgi:hypothetical protein
MGRHKSLGALLLVIERAALETQEAEVHIISQLIVKRRPRYTESVNE